MDVQPADLIVLPLKEDVDAMTRVVWKSRTIAFGGTHGVGKVTSPGTPIMLISDRFGFIAIHFCISRGRVIRINWAPYCIFSLELVAVKAEPL